MTDEAVKQGNPIAVGALVLGLVAVVSAALIRADVLTVIAGLVAIALGLAGFARSKALDFGKGRTLAIIGGIAGAFAIVTNLTGLWV